MHPFTNMHIMKKYILLFLCLIIVSGSFAQMQDFKFKFYGQIRTDLYYNSRANEETVEFELEILHLCETARYDYQAKK